MLLFCFCFSTVAVLISFLAEFAWQLKPCRLCKLQRLPLVAIMPLSLFGLLSSYKWISINLIKLSFLCLSAISGYHVMIQAGIVSDPCEVPHVKTIEDFKSLMTDPPLSCKASTLSLFGISASGYLSVFAFVFLLVLPRKQNDDLSKI